MFGLAVYYSLACKHAVGRLTGTLEQIQKQMPYSMLTTYQSPLSSAFMLDCLMPLFRYCLKNTKSATLKALGFEALSLWIYVNQNQPTTPIFEDLGHYTKDEQSIQFIVQSFF